MLITDEYRELNAQLHKSKPSYGAGGHHHYDKAVDLITKYCCIDLLDYGCGKSTLTIKYSVNKLIGYDPAFPDKQYKEPCDLVVCLDVLEHIEPNCLQDVLRDIKDLTKKCFFCTIATRPAKKTLADGRNAHLIIERPLWWLEQLDNYFDLRHITINSDKGEVQVECQTK